MVSAFVFRGRAHALLHEYLYHGIPAVHVPDTVADAVLDAPLGDWDATLVGSFGTVTGIRDRWPAFYGAEVLDLIAGDPRLTGVLVVRGSVGAVSQVVKSRGLSRRVAVHDAMPQEALLDLIRSAGFVTSYQTGNLAGWVRTTGKLPLVLGVGRGALATDVGEAHFVLPRDQLLPCDQNSFTTSALARIAKGWTASDAQKAQRTGTAFARGTQATRLAAWLNGIA
jgi:hypothetical protein